MVEMANWLPTPPMRSLRPGASMTFLFSEPLKAANMLASAAEASADISKSNSYEPAAFFFRAAYDTPPTMIGRHIHLGLETVLPYTNVLMTAANTGSEALTIWANDTAPAPMANTEALCAAAEQKATGSMVTMSLMVTLGTFRTSGAAHRYRAYSMPTPSCSVAIVSGKPSAPPHALSASLFWML